MTGNVLWHQDELNEWEEKFILYDWGTRNERTATLEWLDDFRQIIAFEHFARPSPNARHNGRIQIQNYLPLNTTKIEEYRRIRIHFTKDTGWIALAEWWSGATWQDDEYAARISMGYTAAGELIFYLDKQKLGEVLWENVWVSNPVPIPVGEWFDLYIRLIAGDETTGFFQVAFRNPGDTWTRIVDINNYTYNPDSPEIVLPHFTNPLMLYTSSETIKDVLKRKQRCKIDLRVFEQWVE